MAYPQELRNQAIEPLTEVKWAFYGVPMRTIDLGRGRFFPGSCLVWGFPRYLRFACLPGQAFRQPRAGRVRTFKTIGEGLRECTILQLIGTWRVIHSGFFADRDSFHSPPKVLVVTFLG